MLPDLLKMFDHEWTKWTNANANNTYASIAKISASFLGVISDIDKLLGTNSNYLLGVWLNTAKKFAKSEKELELIEFNARNQVSE